MNPSRITTPLDKKIDEWWFRYMGQPLKFDVCLHRTRDIEAERSGMFASKFYAQPNPSSLKRLELKDFPINRIEAPSFVELREKVMDLVNSRQNAVWEKVIIIYMEESVPSQSWDKQTTFKDKDAVKFDYVVCYRSKDNKFWKWPDHTFVTCHMADMMRGSSGGPESLHVVPHTEQMEASLKALDEKLKTFAVSLRALVFNRTDEFVQWATKDTLPLLKA